MDVSLVVPSAVAAVILVAVALAVAMYVGRRSRDTGRAPSRAADGDPAGGSWYFVRYHPLRSEEEREDGSA